MSRALRRCLEIDAYSSRCDWCCIRHQGPPKSEKQKYEPDFRLDAPAVAELHHSYSDDRVRRDLHLHQSLSAQRRASAAALHDGAERRRLQAQVMPLAHV